MTIGFIKKKLDAKEQQVSSLFRKSSATSQQVSFENSVQFFENLNCFG
jgi:hypothetical protein